MVENAIFFRSIDRSKCLKDTQNYFHYMNFCLVMILIVDFVQGFIFLSVHKLG
jgi:hypothetical protein